MTPEERAELEQRRELARQEVASQPPPEETSMMDKVVQGAEQFGQGASLGFADELSSGIRSLIPSERFGDETIPVVAKITMLGKPTVYNKVDLPFSFEFKISKQFDVPVPKEIIKSINDVKSKLKESFKKLF